MSKIFYVYGLIDPRNNLPFYIGKGTINPKRRGVRYRRILEHLSKSDTVNKFKVKVMEKILLNYDKIPYIIYKYFDDEVECFTCEVELISKYGRRDLKSGCLTNLTNGGEGFSGRIKTTEEKFKISQAKKLYYESNPANFKGCKHTEETKRLMSEKQQQMAKHLSMKATGRKHTEETKQKLREINLGRKIPKEICHKFAHHGSNNCQAKTYIFVSPNKECFIVNGEFKKFLIDKGLSIQTFKKFVNKGIIPPPTNPNHNKMTQARLDSTGWEVKYHLE
jgi:hypothetical protein